MTVELLAGPLLALVLGYLLGSIPFGLLLTRLAGGGDIRDIGSGNIGATNVLRTGRKGLAAATLILDMLKGTAAVILADMFFPGNVATPALGALIGHLYPVWLKFAGGKGVATFFGIILAFCILGELRWWAAIAYAVIWLVILATTRFSSLAGMSAALLSPVVAAFLERFDLALLFLGFGLLVFWKHRQNLERLFAGTEPRVGRKKADG